MKPTSLAAAFLLLCLFLGASACTSPGRAFVVDLEDTVLATRTIEDGGRESFVVSRGGHSDIALNRVVETQRGRATLGVRTRELDKDAAQARGVKPYTGLLITSVSRQGPAASAGLLRGDVLLAVDGHELVYQAQLEEQQLTWNEQQEVVLALLRGQERIERTVRIALVERETIKELTNIPLVESAHAAGPFLGVRLRGIPAEYGRDIFGDGRNGVLISYVEVGSPAWRGGLRNGDLVEAIDGGPVPAVADLSRLIAERGAQGGSMQWQVSRGSGPSYSTEVRLHDYRDGTDLWIPLVASVEDGVAHDRWTVGPFGLVASNRNTYVAPTATREAETRNVFSALLGLFRVDSGPRDTSVRLLWIIRFNT